MFSVKESEPTLMAVPEACKARIVVNKNRLNITISQPVLTEIGSDHVTIHSLLFVVDDAELGSNPYFTVTLCSHEDRVCNSFITFILASSALQTTLN